MSADEKRRKLPPAGGPGSYGEDPRFRAARAIFEPEGYSVYSHSDDPMPGRTPANAVVFVLWLRFEGEKIGVAMRLKSRAAVDELIDSLERHAVDVWPKT